jgi:hypothetical protein
MAENYVKDDANGTIPRRVSACACGLAIARLAGVISTRNTSTDDDDDDDDDANADDEDDEDGADEDDDGHGDGDVA